MALKPHLWAYDEAPVENPTAVLVLLALADEAADDGTGACPYMDKLTKRARVSERSVQNHLRDLYRARLIDKGDPGIAQRRYKKAAGQAPRCWNLNMAATWESVPTPRTDDEMRREYSAAIGVKPPRRRQVTAAVQDLHPASDQGEQETEVQDLHPSDPADEVQPTAPDRCSPLHPTGEAGRTLPAVCLSDPEKTPPTPADRDRPGDVVAEAAGGDIPPTTTPDDDEPDDDETTRYLNAAVDLAVQARDGAAGWSVGQVRHALRQAIGAGFDPITAADTLAILADDKSTGYPGRLKAYLELATKRTAAAAATPAPAWVEGPFRYLAADAPRCRKHHDQPADGCNPCAGDAKGVSDDEPSTAPMSAAAARELARQNAAAARGKAPAPRQATPQVPPTTTAFGQAIAAMADAMSVQS